MAERICLVTDQTLDIDPFPEGDWPCDPRPFREEAEWEVLTVDKASSVSRVVQAARRGVDLFFNLCDGAWDEGRAGIEVVQTLEALDVPFTGADSDFFEPSREAMKRVCRAWGVDTPAYLVASDDAHVEEAADTLHFPLFVKHPSSYASSGLTGASRVGSVAELREQVSIMVSQYGSALIEEFIEGTECTVLVAENAQDPGEPIVFKPLRYRFPEGESFKHYALKWVDYAGLESLPVEDQALEARLRRASSLFFQGMRGAGYGRCDVRVDRDGRAFMLEINPNCGIYYPPTDPGSADLILHHDPMGHRGFTDLVVAAAYARHARRQRSWRVLSRPGSDYGVFARRRIERGERVMIWEEQAHHLVTRRHVESQWDARRREWFERYAWPLSDEVWVMWSADPEDWCPVNHACDPSAWLEGLDVVACRDIAAGEEITLEYGTFHDEHMVPFECACGSPSCRRTIRGDDYRLPALDRYEGHFSAHVAMRRQAHRGVPHG